MKTKIFVIAASLLWLILACDEKKKEITQELCESQTNQADCEAAGCTYTCGMVLRRDSEENGWECMSRRKVARCLAVVKLVEEESNNQDYFYAIFPNSSAWLRDEVVDYSVGMSVDRYIEYFKVDNQRDYAVEVMGHHSYTSTFEGMDIDPCHADDPEGTLFPWEGSCETDWWSEYMWDDVLPE